MKASKETVNVVASLILTVATIALSFLSWRLAAAFFVYLVMVNIGGIKGKIGLE